MEKIRPSVVRKQAWDGMSGLWGASALVSLAFFVLIMCIYCVSRFPNSQYAQSFIYLALLVGVAPVSIGFNFVFQDLLRHSTKPTIQAMFGLMKEYLRYLSGAVLVAVYTFLWSLLLFVPGMIKSLSYSMTYYIMRDNPDIVASEAITRSQQMMKGHKMELFLLSLSFIGWYFLGIITLVGCLWVLPYISTACAAFYERIKDVEEV